jgi:predicted lipid-binding transport protein (Tim44 family)
VKQILLSLIVGALGFGFAAEPVEARRLGGGMSQGMKRPAPMQRQQTPQQPPANAAPATPANAGAAAAATPKRSWMGPVAGLAAGLGLAALASHFGFGEGLANFMTMALLAFAAVFVVRFLLRRFAPAAPQRSPYAAAGHPGAFGAPREQTATLRSASALPAASAPQGSALPAGFDAATFERAAKMIFIRMQAANDAGDLDDLRRFSTPEMFAAFRLDLQDRTGSAQRTDVMQLDADVVEVADEAAQQVVSVRFHGLIREEQEGAAAPFDEIWHLVRPSDGSREWAIAGIAQNTTA